MAAVDSGEDSAFATTVKAGRWPSLEILDQLADAHEQQASTLRTAGDTSCNVHRPRLKEALKGQGGTEQIAEHNANIGLWDTHADLYKTSGDAVRLAAGELRSLQHDLRLLIEDKEPQYQAATRSGKTVAAQAIMTSTLTEADDMVAKRGQTATMYVRGVNFTAPLPDRPATDPDGQNGQNGNPHHDKNTDLPVDGDTKTTAKGGDTGDAAAGQSQRDVETGLPPDATTPLTQSLPRDVQTDLPPAGPANGGPAPATSPLTTFPQALGGSMGRAASGSGGGGAGGGSALSGLGSGLNPGSMGSGIPTSPASSLGSAPAAQSAASPLANAGSSFQSGLASGMGATAPPPVAAQPIAQQATAAQQPLMGSPAAGSGSAGVPVAPHEVPDGGGTGPVQGGSGGGPVGGAPMMPPAAMGAGPLAPYSAPGAGGAPPAGGAPTTPAAGGQASSGGGAAPAGGSGLPSGPVLAGGAGSGSAMGGMAASASEVSADMLLAQRVLGGLVRGCEFWPSPIAWAVSVVKTPVGSQVVVANSVGGGSYLPATVFLPSTARLAVVDPALPFGWAQRWMGCQKPSKILVDHFERLSKRVAGASISAMVTTELWPVEPAGVGEFLGLQHRQALGLLSVAPVLDGAHQHRLTALDPVLAQRVSSIASNVDVAVRAAAQLTVTVIRAAQAPDATGKPLAFQDEVNVLQAVSAGTADEATWDSYNAKVATRDGEAWLWPESHAALDHDGSELSESMNLWYRRYFQGGRIVELVQSWKNSAAPLAEIAYCGVQAGFGAVVTATISAIEEQLRRGGGPRL